MWLQWTAPNNGAATFSTRGSSFDTLLAIYSNAPLASLTTNIAASDEDRGGYFTSEAVFNAQAGSNYLIAIDGFAGDAGNIVLSWSLDTNLTLMPKILQQPVSTTAPAGGTVMFSVSAFSSTNISYQWFFNCCLAIAGATNATLTLSNVGVLDVGYYTVEVTGGAGQMVRSVQAVLEISTGGSVPSEDKFEDLLVNGVAGLAGEKGGPKSLVSVSAGTVNQQIINATGSSTQSRETNHCGIIGGVSRWLSLKALTNGTFVINTIGSTLDTVLAVYVGSNLLNLQFVACDDNSAPDGVRSLVRFPATAGVTYMVAVDSVGGVPGIIQVNWGIGSAPVLNVTPTNFSAPGRRHADVQRRADQLQSGARLSMGLEPGWNHWRDERDVHTHEHRVHAGRTLHGNRQQFRRLAHERGRRGERAACVSIEWRAAARERSAAI